MLQLHTQSRIASMTSWIAFIVPAEQMLDVETISLRRAQEL